MGWLFIVLGVVFIVLSIFIVCLVLIQPHSEGGLVAAFGGMGGDSFFGTKAINQIAKFTIWMAVAFLGLAVLLNRIVHSSGEAGGSVFRTAPAGGRPEEAPPGEAPPTETPPAPPGGAKEPSSSGAPPAGAPPVATPPSSSAPAAPAPSSPAPTPPKQ